MDGRQCRGPLRADAGGGCARQHVRVLTSAWPHPCGHPALRAGRRPPPAPVQRGASCASPFGLARSVAPGERVGDVDGGKHRPLMPGAGESRRGQCHVISAGHLPPVDGRPTATRHPSRPALPGAHHSLSLAPRCPRRAMPARNRARHGPARQRYCDPFWSGFLPVWLAEHRRGRRIRPRQGDSTGCRVRAVGTRMCRQRAPPDPRSTGEPARGTDTRAGQGKRAD